MSIFTKIAKLATSVYSVFKQLQPFINAAREVSDPVDDFVTKVENIKDGAESDAAKFINVQAPHLATVREFAERQINAWQQTIEFIDATTDAAEDDEVDIGEGREIAQQGYEAVQAHRACYANIDNVKAAAASLAEA